MTRTILVDDHKVFSDGLKKLLEDSSQFQILQQFTKGDQLLENIFNLSPELLVMDIEIIGELDGIEVLRRIRLKDKSVKVVMLSMHEENIYSREAFSMGANAYLTKSLEGNLLIEYLLKVMSGEKIFPSSYSSSVVETKIISNQEQRILKLIAEGMTSAKIAEQLNISPLTVKAHRKNIMTKLGAESSAELISIAFSRGIL